MKIDISSLTVFLIALIIFFSPTVEADVISVNAGGSNETAVTPDKYVEGFFSGIPESAAEVTTPSGGAGGGGAATSANVALTPAEFNINMVVNTTTERTISIRNLGTSPLTVAVTESNLGNHVILGNKSLIIPAGQSVNLKVVFVALSEPGIFAGTINIGGKTVLVSLNVKTQLLLFDSNIIVLNRNYQVLQGDDLRTRVTLTPLGDPERLDVGLFFTIRDYSGKIYLTKSETMLVEELTEVNRNFDTGSLPLGKYVVGLELKYPNGVAPSSAHFEVLEKKVSTLGSVIPYLLSFILLIFIIILLLLIRKRIKEKE